MIKRLSKKQISNLFDGGLYESKDNKWQSDGKIMFPKMDIDTYVSGGSKREFDSIVATGSTYNCELTFDRIEESKYNGKVVTFKNGDKVRKVSLKYLIFVYQISHPGQKLSKMEEWSIMTNREKVAPVKFENGYIMPMHSELTE
jgi:hypothetical protein